VPFFGTIEIEFERLSECFDLTITPSFGKKYSVEVYLYNSLSNVIQNYLLKEKFHVNSASTYFIFEDFYRTNITNPDDCEDL
jgi:hypothetical protein